MKFYFAGCEKGDLKTLQQAAFSHGYELRLLFSYAMCEKRKYDLDRIFSEYFIEPYPDFFLDSGAFTAKMLGTTITLYRYCDYVKRFSRYITTYSNLDVIGDAEATLVNQKRMEDQGLHPLPVFHIGDPWKYLDYYLERYSYIAIGGLVMYAKAASKTLPWLLQAFRMAKGKAVFHGFGTNNWKVVSSLPWYSVDSTSWAEGKKFRHASVFHPAKGKFEELFFGNQESCRKMTSLLYSLNIDPKPFFSKEYDIAAMNGLGLVSYLTATRWVTQRHGEIIIPERKSGDA